MQVLNLVEAKISDEEAINACKTELGVDDPTIAGFERLKDYDESNSIYHNFISCTWKHLALQNSDGKVNFPNLIDYVAEFCNKRAAEVFTVVPDRATVEGWLSGCRELHGDTAGKTAAKVHFCLAKGIDQFRSTHKKH